MTLSEMVTAAERVLIILTVLAGTHAIVLLVNRLWMHFAQRWYPKMNWSIIKASSVSAVLYLISLNVLLGLFKLPPSIENVLSHIIYCLSVIVIVNAIKVILVFVVESKLLETISASVSYEVLLPLTQNTINVVSMVSVIVLILQHFHYDVMSLVTALGVGSLAMGLAAKDSLSQLIAGFVIMLDKQVHAGDMVQFDSALGVGTILKIGLRSTQLQLSNGNLGVVPNSDLLNTKLQVLSRPTWEGKVKFTFYVNVKENPEKVCIIVRQTFEAFDNQGILTHKKFEVVVSQLLEKFIVFEVQYWISDIRKQKEINGAFQMILLANLHKNTIALGE